MRIRSVLGLAFAAAFLALSSGSLLLAQQKTAAPSPTRPKIRTITAFLNLDRTQYQQQIADALQMLRRAKTIFESRGYEVQTIRIATQPFPAGCAVHQRRKRRRGQSAPELRPRPA